MLHVHSLEDVSLQRSWLAIGVFDGVHRGHQEILAHLTAGAHAVGASAVVLTFYPHPAAVLGKRNGLKYLTLPDEKAALLGDLGVDVVVTHPFDHDVAALSAEAFMTRVQAHLNAEKLLIGYDFALGREREGDAVRLAELGKKLGFALQSCAPVTYGGEIVSSSHIRAYLSAGLVAEAWQALGRYYALCGPVVRGDGRGRKIDIPTVNIDVPAGKAIPANGVYACWAYVGDERRLAVTNVGVRPTFTPDEEIPGVEAHLLDFRRDLYDQDLKLEFVTRLRDERKFSSVEALLAQIHKDIASTREILRSRAGVKAARKK